MKILIEKIFIIFFILLSIKNTTTHYNKKLIPQIDQDIEGFKQHQERKLSYSPYLSSFEDYSAKKIGEQDQGDSQAYLGATPVGTEATNMSSIMPTSFSGGNVLPGSQMFPMDHLNFPQHLSTTALYNPLGGNPVLNAGNTSLAMVNQGQQSMQSFATQQFAPPIIKVEEKCQSVLKQAVKIAQTVMESQFEQMAQFITKYLSQSRYSQEMSELQLTRQLRQDMFKHMQDYANLGIKNIVFRPSNSKYDVQEDMLIKNIKKLANQDIDFKRPKIENFVQKI